MPVILVQVGLKIVKEQEEAPFIQSGYNVMQSAFHRDLGVIQILSQGHKLIGL